MVLSLHVGHSQLCTVAHSQLCTVESANTVGKRGKEEKGTITCAPHWILHHPTHQHTYIKDPLPSELENLKFTTMQHNVCALPANWTKAYWTLLRIQLSFPLHYIHMPGNVPLLAYWWPAWVNTFWEVSLCLKYIMISSRKSTSCPICFRFKSHAWIHRKYRPPRKCSGNQKRKRYWSSEKKTAHLKENEK